MKTFEDDRPDAGADDVSGDHAGKMDGGIETTGDARSTQLESESAEGEHIRTELNSLTDRHLRLAAEFDNYRKRTERERSETWTRSQAEFAGSLLDVVDDLQRVAHVDPETATTDSVLEGIQLVERKLQRVLAAAGLEEVDAMDQPFDPATMEALMTVPAESGQEDESVAAVLQKGYRFKGHLLRPARVQVRKHDG